MDAEKDYKKAIEKVRKAEALLKESYSICNKYLDEDTFLDASNCIGNALCELSYL